MTCAEVGKNENWAYGKALQTGELSYNLAKRLELKHAFWTGQILWHNWTIQLKYQRKQKSGK